MLFACRMAVALVITNTVNSAANSVGDRTASAEVEEMLLERFKLLLLNNVHNAVCIECLAVLLDRV